MRSITLFFCMLSAVSVAACEVRPLGYYRTGYYYYQPPPSVAYQPVPVAPADYYYEAPPAVLGPVPAGAVAYFHDPSYGYVWVGGRPGGYVYLGGPRLSVGFVGHPVPYYYHNFYAYGGGVVHFHNGRGWVMRRR